MTETTPNFSISLAFTALFVLALLAGLIVRLWLNSRQIQHVAQFRSKVPTAFAKNIALTSHQKAADYTIAKMRFGLLELAVGTAVILGWTLLGGLSILNQALTNLLGTGMGQQIALLAAFAMISSLIDSPRAVYETFVIEERFGFNKMPIRLWLGDLIKSGIISALIGLPLIALILWIMGVTGSWWWLWTWCVWIGFNLILLLAYPTLIAPIFNKFKPLEDEELKSHVVLLMQRCGFAAKGLYVMDGSRRSSHANAYFTGFGASKRVVFYDTLLAKLSSDEVNAVLAHELGHFKHKHIVKRIASMSVISLLGFAILGCLATQVWFYSGLGVQPNLNAANDALALLLFLFVFPTFGFFVTAPLHLAFRANKSLKLMLMLSFKPMVLICRRRYLRCMKIMRQP